MILEFEGRALGLVKLSFGILEGGWLASWQAQDVDSQGCCPFSLSAVVLSCFWLLSFLAFGCCPFSLSAVVLSKF